MTLLDVNILIFATSRKPEYSRLAGWFEDTMNGTERVAIPWHTLLGFLRVATQQAGTNPMPMATALEHVAGWLSWDMVWVPQPTDNHFKIVNRLLRERPKSRLVPDAHLAALAIEHNLTLCSTDSDFRAFNGLKFLNPLE